MRRAARTDANHREIMTSPSIITFTVPGDPVGKGRPQIVRILGQSRMKTPEKTANYEGLVAWAAQQSMNGLPPFDEAVSVLMEIRCPVPASWSKRKQKEALEQRLLPSVRPDIDNIVKAIFDGMNGVVWRDDVLVTSLLVEKRYAETPGVQVTAHPAIDKSPLD